MWNFLSRLSHAPRPLSPLILLGLITLTGVPHVNAEPPGKTQTASIEHTPELSDEIQSQAKALFMKRCSRCHGGRGDGKGVFAHRLTPSPTDLTSPTWYQQTDEKKIRRVIIGGGRAIGKSPLMPSHPDLRNKRELLKALVHYVIKLAPRSNRP